MAADKNRESLKDRLNRSGINTIDGQNRKSLDNPDSINPLSEGDLKDKPISWILQVAQHYEVTGHLSVGSAACSVKIQFGLGRPLNAFSPFSSGAGTIVDLFTWREGKFSFQDGLKPEGVTIDESPETLLALGEAYSTDLIYLEKNFISESSILLRPAGRTSKEEVANYIQSQSALYHEKQLEFYDSVYGSLNVKDIAEKLSLQRFQGVIIVASLLRLGLILTPEGKSLKSTELENITKALPSTIQPSPESAPTPLPEPFQPQSGSIQQVQPQFPQTLASEQGPVRYLGIPENEIKSDISVLEKADGVICDTDTGIISSDLFHYFIQSEFARASRFGTILSLIVFGIKTRNQSEDKMQLSDLKKLTGAISGIKRDVDILGHFSDQLYGILLPMVDGDQASVLVDRIMKELPPKIPELGAYGPVLYFGIASAPEDATDKDELLLICQRAMKQACHTNKLKLQAKELMV